MAQFLNEGLALLVLAHEREEELGDAAELRRVDGVVAREPPNGVRKEVVNRVGAPLAELGEEQTRQVADATVAVLQAGRDLRHPAPA